MWIVVLLLRVGVWCGRHLKHLVLFLGTLELTLVLAIKYQWWTRGRFKAWCWSLVHHEILNLAWLRSTLGGISERTNLRSRLWEHFSSLWISKLRSELPPILYLKGFDWLLRLTVLGRSECTETIRAIFLVLCKAIGLEYVSRFSLFLLLL